GHGFRNDDAPLALLAAHLSTARVGGNAVCPAAMRAAESNGHAASQENGATSRIDQRPSHPGRETHSTRTATWKSRGKGTSIVAYGTTADERGWPLVATRGLACGGPGTDPHARPRVATR